MHYSVSEIRPSPLHRPPQVAAINVANGVLGTPDGPSNRLTFPQFRTRITTCYPNRVDTGPCFRTRVTTCYPNRVDTGPCFSYQGYHVLSESSGHRPLFSYQGYHMLSLAPAGRTLYIGAQRTTKYTVNQADGS